MLFITGPWVHIADMPNWIRLSEKISDLEGRQQHFTTSTKLHVAKLHLDRTSRLIPNQKATDLMELETDDQGHLKAVFDGIYLQRTVDYLGELDAFFYCLRSCIDSFLWQANLFYRLGCSRAVDVWSAIKQKHMGKKINDLLQDLRHRPWFKYLNDYRNFVTHRKLSEMATYTEDLKLYLPSNPRSESTIESYSREEDFEVVSCIRNLLRNVMEFLEKGYGLIMDDLTFCSQSHTSLGASLGKINLH